MPFKYNDLEFGWFSQQELVGQISGINLYEYAVSLIARLKGNHGLHYTSMEEQLKYE